MSHKKPEGLSAQTKHERCPVCGEVSYSVSGVHPQCSVKQADEKRIERIKKNKAAEKSAKPARAISQWQKTCPKCNAVQHVRKKVCECGRNLSSSGRPSANSSESL